MSDRESFRFAVLHDLHYRDEVCREWLEHVFRQIRQSGAIDFCLIGGDLTENGSDKELAEISAVLGESKLPFRAVIGNHEYRADGSTAFDRFFPESRNYFFQRGGWTFVGLDTTAGKEWDQTEVPAATLEWLELVFRPTAPRGPIVVFTHFPLGPGVRYRPLNADRVMEWLRALDVRAVFCGHFHCRIEQSEGAIRFFNNSTVSCHREMHGEGQKRGWYLCSVTGDDLKIEFREVDAAS